MGDIASASMNIDTFGRERPPESEWMAQDSHCMFSIYVPVSLPALKYTCTVYALPMDALVASCC